MNDRDIILFDIDGVIFDSESFIENKRVELIKTFGLSSDEIKNADSAAADATKEELGVFNTEVYSKKLSNLLGRPEKSIQIREMFKDEKLYVGCLFSDVLPFLKKLFGSYRLGIFSQGDPEFQMLKLEKTGVISFFDPSLIFIYKNKKESVKKISQEMKIILAVDNSSEIIEAWRQNFVKGILVKRGRYFDVSVKTDSTFEVKSLEEINLKA